MSLTSKSPQDVAREALAAGTAALTLYSHKFSPKVFTQPQLLACLVLRKFFKTDYRGIVAILKDSSDLRTLLQLSKVPHFTTLQKAAARLLADPRFRELLRATLRRAMGRRRKVPHAAADSSGLACGHASRYCVRRRAKGQDKNQTPAQTTFYTRFAKLELVVDTGTHMILGALAGRGPAPDVDRLIPLLDAVDPSLRLERLYADAGYDSELNHVFARVGSGIQTLIPARGGRPGAGPPAGHWRRNMRKRLATKALRKRAGYHRRPQVETGISMIKRRQGEAVAAREFPNQCAELYLMVVTHNVMIPLRMVGFLKSWAMSYCITFDRVWQIESFLVRPHRAAGGG